MHIFLLFALLPALVLCMVTSQVENKKRKRTSALNMVESPVQNERVTVSEGIDRLSSAEIFELNEFLEQSSFNDYDDMAASDNVPISQLAPPHIENLAERVFSNPIGAVSHIAIFLDAKDFKNLVRSKVNLRKSRFFYSKKTIRIPWDATEDDVRSMLNIQQVEKVIIGFNLGHLTILQECPNLRHLIVWNQTPDVWNEATESSFMNKLSKIDDPKDR
jgi:hypothetical protein